MCGQLIIGKIICLADTDTDDKCMLNLNTNLFVFNKYPIGLNGYLFETNVCAFIRPSPVTQIIFLGVYVRIFRYVLSH